MRIQYKSKKNKKNNDECWSDKITIIIKTFQRQHLLRQLIESIRNKYPKILIKVADDGHAPSALNIDNVDYYILPYDIGLSAGRNFLLNKVKTKYFVLLDDDHVFIEKTKLDKMFNILEKYRQIDLLSGRVKHIRKNGTSFSSFCGIFEYKGRTLYRYANRNRDVIGGMKIYDIVENFFMARTKKIMNVMWDARLKLSEHGDFFLRCKRQNLTVAMDYDIHIGHDKKTTTSICYKKHRNRSIFYHKLFYKKNNISRIIVVQPNNKRVIKL